MKNRQPTPGQEGRVLITPEDPSIEPFYAKVSMADNPLDDGTLLDKELLDHVIAEYGTTDGTGTAYTLDGDGGFALVDGATIRFKLHVDSGATPTINVNNTGSKALMQSHKKPLRAGTKAGTWIVATYCADLDFFVLQGSETGSNSLAHSHLVSQLLGIVLYYDNERNPLIWE